MHMPALLAAATGPLESNISVYAVWGAVILFFLLSGGSKERGVDGKAVGRALGTIIAVLFVAAVGFYTVRPTPGMGDSGGARAGEAVDRWLPLDFLGGPDGEL